MARQRDDRPTAPPRRRGGYRSLVVACALVAATGCTWDGDAAPEGPAVPESPPTTLDQVALPAIDDFVGASNEERFASPEAERSIAVTSVGSPDLEISLAHHAVLTFDVSDPVADPCLERVELQLRLVDDHDLEGLVVYPSKLEPLDRPDGHRIDGTLLLDNRPRGVFEVRDDLAVADVTEIYRRWVGDGAFPSRMMRPADPTKLVLVVRPEAFTLELADLLPIFHSSESASPPELRLHRSCRTAPSSR